MGQDSRKKILMIGSIMLDVVCRVDSLPQAGEGIVCQDHSFSLGGCAYNSAVAIRQLGGECFLMAPVGNGPAASFIASRLRERGLEAWRPETSWDSGIAICLVDETAERTMVSLPGADRHFETKWFEGFDASAYSFVCVTGYEIEGAGGCAIIDFLESNPHLQVFFAPGPRTASITPEKYRRINALHPIWHLNDSEALCYTQAASLEQAAFDIAEKTRNAVVITCGKDGALCFDGQTLIRVPAVCVEPIDTVGAGDSHLGALLALRSRGFSWEDSLKTANRLSALVCKTKGSCLSDDYAKSVFAL